MQDSKHLRRAGPAGLSRRQLLRRGAAAAAALAVVPRRVLGGPGNKPPSDRLGLAAVGLGSMGYTTLENCVCPEHLGGPWRKRSDDESVVALCDVDPKTAAVAFERWPKAKPYTDFRKMLDAEKSIDAVVVATPDHTHAVVTAAAMRSGKHVYTQMPLAHDVWEARQLAAIARETGVTTQLGVQRHASPVIRRVCEWLWDGAVGTVREVHAWTRRPIWPQGMGRPKGRAARPDALDWNLWVGPASMRPYHPAYHPYNWRGWCDFGTGALGAMGCHVLDAAFWALKLDQADRFSVQAECTGINGETWPKASTIRYSFPARGDNPPVTLTWYDGGRKPQRPDGIPELRGLGANGSLFVGDKGTLACGAVANVNDPDDDIPMLLPESRLREYRPPRKTLPRIKGPWEHNWLGNHEHDWVDACKKGAQPCCPFRYGGPLTEMVLLGNVALLAGKPIEWDSKALKIVGEPAANQHLRRNYRSGWAL
ncbi:MAG: Gfo/Idh/MocA family protein [bacterium]